MGICTRIEVVRVDHSKRFNYSVTLRLLDNGLDECQRNIQLFMFSYELL